MSILCHLWRITELFVGPFLRDVFSFTSSLLRQFHLTTEVVVFFSPSEEKITIAALPVLAFVIYGEEECGLAFLR